MPRRRRQAQPDSVWLRTRPGIPHPFLDAGQCGLRTKPDPEERELALAKAKLGWAVRLGAKEPPERAARIHRENLNFVPILHGIDVLHVRDRQYALGACLVGVSGAAP